MIKLIAAIDTKRGIASNGVIPWDLPSDRKRFAELTKTMGGVIIMGSKTYEVTGAVLPDRRNIIVSRDVNYKVAGAEVVHTLDEALALAPDVWVIGGAEIFAQALDRADGLEITKVDGDYGCDRFFPPFESDFVLTGTSLPMQENGTTFVYSTYTRK